MRLFQRLFLCPAALALLTLVVGGFSNATGLLLAPGDPPASQKPGATAPAAAGDESLTAPDYIRLGLPAPDRDWNGVDMAKAKEVLSSLAQKGARQLPRYKSERSGTVFDRMTSPQNLKPLRAPNLPLSLRLSQMLSYYQASNEILVLYLNGFLKNDVRDSEMVELLGSQLRSTVVFVALLDELLPTIRKDDPNYKARMQGLEQTKRGLASIVAGSLQTLTEREGYRASERIRLLSYMQETFPFIVPHLAAGPRQETLTRMQQMQADPSLKELQNGLRQLEIKVKAALGQGKAP